MLLKGKRSDLRTRLDYLLDDYDELNEPCKITEAIKEQLDMIDNVIPKLDKHFRELEAKEE
jgi:hypothetical protein